MTLPHPAKPPKADPAEQIRRNVPSALLELPQWVVWRYEEVSDKDGSTRLTKVPYNARRPGHKAKSNCSKTEHRGIKCNCARATWAPFSLAAKVCAAGQYDGLGFVLSPDDPYTGIDLDHCRDPESGQIEAWAQAIIEQLNSYAEISPSGSGVRIFVNAAMPEGKHRAGGIEIYDRARFLTITGNATAPHAGYGIEERQEALDALCFAAFFEEETPADTMRKRNTLHLLGNTTSFDTQEVIRRATASKQGAKFARLWNGNTSDYAGDDSRADMALCAMLAFWIGPDPARIDAAFRESGLMRDKWDSPRGASTYGANTITAVLSSPQREYYTPAHDRITPFPTGGRRGAGAGSGDGAAEGEPPAETGEAQRFAHTELGNAERLYAAHGVNMRYSPAFGYLAWDGARWKPAAELTVRKWAKQTIRAMIGEAADLAKRASQTDTETDEGSERSKALVGASTDLLKWARQSETDRMIKAMLSLNMDTCEVDAARFDAYPMLLNASNGTVDLTTGILRPHAQGDYLMQCAPTAYDPAAKCPTFERFVSQIMCGRADLVAYLQRALGYSITGDVSEQVWHLLVGEGENGKGTLIETVAAVLGEYAGMLEPESITASSQIRDPNAPSPEMARLKGKRLVKITETEEGARIAPARIKRLSGGDELSGRHLRRDLFSFMPTFKLWLYTNHRPQARETTHAFWRRVRYIPFDFNLREHPEMKDTELPAKLRQEAPGILAWLVRGCLEWQRQKGLNPPAEVLEAVEEYKRDSDILRQFLDERILVRHQGMVAAKLIYEAYKAWCDESGERPMSQRRLGEALSERGFSRSHHRTGSFWLDVALVD